MNANPEEQKGFSIGLLIVGTFAGLLGGTIAVVVCGFFLLSVLVRIRAVWLVPLANAALLVLLGYFALKSGADRGFARGLVVGFSLIFVLNAICGVSMLGQW